LFFKERDGKSLRLSSREGENDWDEEKC
jgi:hypothetical protein